MNVLLIGSGGREHALAFKLAQSKRLGRLYIAPGNGGTIGLAEIADIDVTQHDQVIEFCQVRQVELVIIGPEAPLVAGLADDLRVAGILAFGPGREAAQLEGSKTFTKILCAEMGIPTAAYRQFGNMDDALAYLDEIGAPIVIKADGLAAGKGVTVAMSLGDAKEAVRDCFNGAYGTAGASVVIEEFLEGEEASVFAICDGQRALLMATAQDHKRAYEGDTGPNTGGMGAYSPAPVVTEEILEEIRTKIIDPTMAGMAARGTPFSGVLYAGLMLTKNGPSLIEYNARFGDPECQVLMLRLESDLLDLLEASAKGDLSGIEMRWSDDAAMTVVLAAKGYPGPYKKGTMIGEFDAINGDDIQIFHAGTKRDGPRLLANGGRVLNVTARGKTIAEAQARAYAAVDAIDWSDGFCRRDIGWRALTPKSPS